MKVRRKKPVIVEAEQWWPGKKVAGVCECQNLVLLADNTKSIGLPHIHTLDGAYLVTPCDWVITNPEAELSLCKPNIFEATYERVNEDGQ